MVIKTESVEQDSEKVSRMSGVWFWSSRTKGERYLTLALTTVAFVAVVLAFTLATFITKTNQISKERSLPVRQALHSKTAIEVEQTTNDICLTKGCVKAAAALIKRMNESVNPCDDFFEFSCGTFVKNTIIPDEKSSVTVFTEMDDELQKKLRLLVQEPIVESDSNSTQMVKNLYKSCMNRTEINKMGLKPLEAILKELGGWPVVEGESWNESKFSWVELNYKNRKSGYSVDYLFDFSVEPDDKNSSWRMIWVDQPGLGMSREYLIKGLNDTDVQAYYKYSIDVAKLLGANLTTVEKEMLDVLNFQIAMANISLPREERRNKTKLYNVMTLKDLATKVPDIPWLTYFNTLLPENVSVTEDERIGVTDINYFINFSKIIRKTPKRTVANYLLWRVSADSVLFLSEDIRSIEQEYSKKLTGKSERPPRWKECMRLTSGKLAYAMGSLYVKNFFDENAKSQADTLVSYVRTQFDEILNNVDWMDETTRAQALKKDSAIKAHIAYPKELLMDEKLTEHYNNLVVDDKVLLDNIRQIIIFETNYSFIRLREKVDKLEWKRQAAAAVVNAYYSFIENSIKFPAGVLQGVFFEPDRPKYMNFGGVGFVIGHEITHGFDDQGKQFDSEGNLKNWWEKATEQKYLAKAKCIIDQYSNYSAPENGMSLNGITTQGENIADNGGIKEAYNAYQKWVKDFGPEKSLPGVPYTPNQLFWVSSAQVLCSKDRPEALKIKILTKPHSPQRFRVIGPLSNAEEFARDWKCPVGSKMNPSHKCQVW